MIKYQIALTQTAKNDIIDIGDYISYILLEPDISKKFIKGLRNSISQLQYFPSKFPIIQDEILYSKGIRCKPYKNYYIFYMIADASQTVLILRVGYNKRNWKDILL